MSLTTIAKPYAKAVFDHALTNNSNKEWLSFFSGIEKVFGNKDLLRFIRSPKLNSQTKFDFLMDLIVKALGSKLSNPQENFMRLIVDNDRVEVLSEIALSFRDMISSSGKSRQFKVISAYALSVDEQKGLVKTLSDKFDCDAHLEVEVQVGLIGGVIIKDGDRIIDGSVNAQLEKLGYCLS
jgi:F-type H+-transporting ATPase subunit delta